MKRKLIYTIGIIIVLGVSWLWYSFRASRVSVEDKAPFPLVNINSSNNSVNLENEPRLSVVAENLDVPWDLIFLPSGEVIFTERGGRVQMIDRIGDVVVEPLYVFDDIALEGESGLLGIALHPDFSQNNYVYIYYSSTLEGRQRNRVIRFTFSRDSLKLTEDRVIIDNIPFARFHDGGRIEFGPDSKLYIATGDSLQRSLAQDLNSLAGKILRLNDDGTIPGDNPFEESAVYSYGHRNPQGLSWDGQGQLYATEHGEQAHDEVNRIDAGKNYGWPLIEGSTLRPEMMTPLIHSGEETWAPSGAAFLESRGSLFFTGLRGQALYELNPATQDLRVHFSKEFGRLRTVKVGPDGFLYLLTNNRDGRGVPKTEDDQIIRVNPVKLE